LYKSSTNINKDTDADVDDSNGDEEDVLDALWMANAMQTRLSDDDDDDDDNIIISNNSKKIQQNLKRRSSCMSQDDELLQTDLNNDRFCRAMPHPTAMFQSVVFIVDTSLLTSTVPSLDRKGDLHIEDKKAISDMVSFKLRENMSVGDFQRYLAWSHRLRRPTGVSEETDKNFQGNDYIRLYIPDNSSSPKVLYWQLVNQEATFGQVADWCRESGLALKIMVGYKSMKS